MANKGIKFKLYVLSIFLMAITFVVAGIGYFSQNGIVYNYSYIVNRNLPNIKTISEIISNYRMSRALVTELSSEHLPPEIALENISSYEKLWQKIEEDHQAYLKIEFAPGEDEIYQVFKKDMQRIKHDLDSVVEVYKKGRETGSVNYAQIFSLINKEVRSAGDSFRKAGDKLLDFHVARADMRIVSAAETVKKVSC